MGAFPVAAVALMLGPDRFMDSMRVATNLLGNCVATLVVARWSEFSGNPIGVAVVMAAGQSQATALVTDSVIAHNVTHGVAAAGRQLVSDGGQAKIGPTCGYRAMRSARRSARRGAGVAGAVTL